MKVSQLTHLLEHLARGLEPVVAGSVTADLLALTTAMAPFADRTVADFTRFVGQCEEYQRTGVVAGGGGKKAAAKKAAPDPERISRTVATIQSTLTAIDRGDVSAHRVDEALLPLQALSKADLDDVLAGMKIAGKSKSKPDAIGRIRQILNNQAEAASRVISMREGR